MTIAVTFITFSHINDMLLVLLVYQNDETILDSIIRSDVLPIT